MIDDDHDLGTSLRQMYADLPASETGRDGLDQDILRRGAQRRRRRTLLASGGSALAVAGAVTAVWTAATFGLASERGTTYAGSSTTAATPTASVPAQHPGMAPKPKTGPPPTSPAPTLAVRIGDVWPASTQLRNGVAYPDSTWMDGFVSAPVMGMQICDGRYIAQHDGGTAPGSGLLPVGAANRTAFAGTGVGTASLRNDRVDFSVTAWHDGAAALTDLKNDTGGCRWFGGAGKATPTPIAWSGHAEGFLVRATAGPLTEWAAVQRVGNVIVSANYGAVDSAQARAEAERLSDLVAAKVTAAGLVARVG